MNRKHYDPGLISATELLKAVSVLAPNPMKFYPVYPNEPTGYYRKRGNFVEMCCTILAMGKRLADSTVEVANIHRLRPLTDPLRPDDERYESWTEYVWPFREWLLQHKVEYIASQRYVSNRAEGLQGTYDLKVKVDGLLTRIDFKCTDSMPTYTRYQLAIYDLCDEMTQRFGIQLARGKCTVYPYTEYIDYSRVRLWARTWHSMQEYR